MVGVLAADDDGFRRLALLRPIGADQTNVGVIRFGSGPGKEHMVQMRGRQFCNLGGQCDDRRVRCHEEGVVERQFAHLACGRIRQLATAIADVDAPQTGHAIQNVVALAVGQVNAICAGDDPRAFGRQFVVGGKGVHVVRSIQRLQLGGGQMVGDGSHDGVLFIRNEVGRRI